MTAMLTTVAVFAVLGYGLKAAGPVLLTDREMPERAVVVVDALPVALLAGMIASTLVGARGSTLDPTALAGLAAGAVAWHLHAPMGVSVVVAVVVTVLARGLG